MFYGKLMNKDSKFEDYYLNYEDKFIKDGKCIDIEKNVGANCQSYKIVAPLLTKEEEKEIDFHIEDYVSKICNEIKVTKDIEIYKIIIMKQQEEIERLKKLNKIDKPIVRDCADLLMAMRGKREGYVYFTNSFRIDFENMICPDYSKWARKIDEENALNRLEEYYDNDGRF